LGSSPESGGPLVGASTTTQQSALSIQSRSSQLEVFSSSFDLR
jgi:hypothetical protein